VRCGLDEVILSFFYFYFYYFFMFLMYGTA
jgi:hypothetical protein